MILLAGWLASDREGGRVVLTLLRLISICSPEPYTPFIDIIGALYLCVCVCVCVCVRVCVCLGLGVCLCLCV